MISLLIRLLLITIGCTWAQDGYYQSAGDLRKIENPDHIFQSEFIWRSQIKDSFQFFQIELNNLLYNNKNIYLWPPEIPLVERPALHFAKTRADLLFNSQLVLSNDTALVAMYNSQQIPLRKISAPGILQVRSAQPLQLRHVKTNSKVGMPTPLFLYNMSDSTPVLYLAFGKGLIPRILDLRTPPATFLVTEIRLDPLPRLTLPAHTLALDSLRRMSNDSLRLIVLDSLLSQTQKRYRDDSLIIARFLKQAQDWIPSPTDSTLTPLVDSLRAATTQELIQVNETDRALGSLREKIALLLNYQREALAGKAARDRLRLTDPPGALLRTHFNGTFYAGLSGLVGRTMPPAASKPGPDRMWGIQGHFSWSRMLGTLLLWENRIDGLYSRWRFNQDFNEPSSQSNVGASLLLGYPLLTAPRVDSLGQLAGGSILMLAMGPTLQARNTHLQGLTGYTSERNLSAGAKMILRVAITRLPLVVDASYTHCLDRYGDLTLGIALPLRFLGVQGARPVGGRP